MRTEKGGGKYDFRSKRKSTNYNFNNHNSAFNHIIGAFNGASWNLLRPIYKYIINYFKNFSSGGGRKLKLKKIFWING